MTSRKLTLTKDPIVSTFAVAQGLADRAEHKEHYDLMSQAIVHSFYTYILGLPEDTIDISRFIPKTWWDAFKLRWFPKWVLRRWPAAQEHIYYYERRYKAVCPHLDPSPRKCCDWFIEQEDN